MKIYISDISRTHKFEAKEEFGSVSDPYKIFLKTHVIQISDYMIGRYVTLKAISSRSVKGSMKVANVFIYKSTDTNNNFRKRFIFYKNCIFLKK